VPAQHRCRARLNQLPRNAVARLSVPTRHRVAPYPRTRSCGALNAVIGCSDTAGGVSASLDPFCHPREKNGVFPKGRTIPEKVETGARTRAIYLIVWSVGLNGSTHNQKASALGLQKTTWARPQDRSIGSGRAPWTEDHYGVSQSSREGEMRTPRAPREEWDIFFRYSEGRTAPAARHMATCRTGGSAEGQCPFSMLSTISSHWWMLDEGWTTGGRVRLRVR